MNAYIDKLVDKLTNGINNLFVLNRYFGTLKFIPEKSLLARSLKTPPFRCPEQCKVFLDGLFVDIQQVRCGFCQRIHTINLNVVTGL